MGDLGEWLGNWLVWLILGGGLAIAELLTMDFVLLMLAGGALTAAIAAAITGSAVISVVVGAVVAISMLGLVRPFALKHLKAGPHVRMGVDALVGKQALVIERVDAHSGRVKIDGEVWTARTHDPVAIEPGRTVDVTQIDGATAYVFDVDKHMEIE